MYVTISAFKKLFHPCFSANSSLAGEPSEIKMFYTFVNDGFFFFSFLKNQLIF